MQENEITIDSIPDFDNEEPTPEFFRSLVNVYYNAARILYEKFPENNLSTGLIDIRRAATQGLILISHPFDFLLAHSLELCMKCYLLQRGVNKAELRKDGHNLEKLMNKCIEKDFDFSEEEKEKVIKMYHKSGHIFRYPKAGRHEFPSCHATFSLLYKFLKETDIY